MAAFETMTAQVICDYAGGGCTNTVRIQNGGIQRVLRHARDSFDWSVIDDQNICPQHKIPAQKKADARKAQNN